MKTGLKLGKAVLIVAIPFFIVGLIYGLYMMQIIHAQSVLGTTLTPCLAEMKGALPDPALNIPCYQKALQIEPHNQKLQYDLAELLAGAGRSTEAREHYNEAAHSIGFYAWRAHQMLGTGEIEKARVSKIISRNELRDYESACARDQSEEAEFVKANDPQWHKGMPLHFPEPVKSQWLRMRSQHAQVEKALRNRL